MLRDIRFRSVCEHHLLPFRGHAHIAYLPGEQVVGLGALPKVVDMLASRPQVQERLGEQIADVIAASLDTRGVLVVLDAVARVRDDARRRSRRTHRPSRSPRAASSPSPRRAPS